MKFLSLIYIFGAIVSPVIAHTDPNVKEAVDAVNQDIAPGRVTVMDATAPTSTASAPALPPTSVTLADAA
ncbi:hypothetical protein E4U37_002161 [Claviceps purpurea]|nr:hypothetical protein E4U37_002161 [Claviceps purpurea]